MFGASWSWLGVSWEEFGLMLSAAGVGGRFGRRLAGVVAGIVALVGTIFIRRYGKDQPVQRCRASQRGI